MTLRTFVLLLHILIAIAAFGPTFAFGLIGRMAEKEPQHGNFALRVGEIIEKRLVLPGSILMPFVGLWLIYLNDWDLWSSEWLLIAIPVYIVAFFFANFVQNRNISKMIQMTGGHGPAAGGEASPIGGPAPVAGAQEGPPPEFLAVSKRVKMGGAFLSLMLLTIIVMMVWKPGGERLLP